VGQAFRPDRDDSTWVATAVGAVLAHKETVEASNFDALRRPGRGSVAHDTLPDMRALAMALFVADVAIWSIGCGRTDLSLRAVDGGTRHGSGTSADFVSTFPGAWCQYEVNCRLSPSVESCLVDHFDSGQPYLAEMSRMIDSGRLVYDSRQGAICANAFATASCSIGEAAPGSPISLACAGMLEGTVPPGGDCVQSDECVSHNCIIPHCGTSCCLGTCAVSATVGASCTDPSACFPDKYCTAGQTMTSNGPYPDTGICQTFMALGQDCANPSSTCQFGLDCDAMTWTCQPFVKDGQPCWPDGPHCDNQASYCNGTPGTCQPRDEPRASCWFPSSATHSCVFYSYCQNQSSDSSVPITGVCVPYPGIGETCDSIGSVYCSCINGTCQYSPESPCAVETAVHPDAGVRD
jgi:hypothetical protein